MKYSIKRPTDLDCIRPELCAKKLAAIHNLEYPEAHDLFAKNPRMAEVLWFIQWASHQPGGLQRLAEQIIEGNQQRLGTKTMHAVSAPIYTRAELRSILGELDHSGLSEADFLRLVADQSLDKEGDRFAKCRCDKDELPAEYFLDEPDCDYEREPGHIKERVAQLIRQNNRESLLKHCRALALDLLPNLLSRFCAEPGNVLPSPAYLDGLREAVLAVMDEHARRTLQQIAHTEVAKLGFDACEFAFCEQALVCVEGDSRFGKTESVQTWCAAFPGRARLVTVPCSNSDADMWRAVADAVGLSYDCGTSSHRIREAVEYVVSHGRLGLFFDEGHYLLPVRFGKNTPPMRLNWVRTQVVDRRIPCVLLSTPQSYQGSLGRFVRKTQYTIEQFIGRITRKVVLPAVLSLDDLVAVAKIHFPELGAAQLKYIAGAAMRSEAYLKAVESVAKLARWKAKQQGRTSILMEDIDLAISEVIPAQPDKPIKASLPPTSIKSRLQMPRTTVADSLQRRGNPSAEPPVLSRFQPSQADQKTTDNLRLGVRVPTKTEEVLA